MLWPYRSEDTGTTRYPKRISYPISRRRVRRRARGAERIRTRPEGEADGQGKREAWSRRWRSWRTAVWVVWRLEQRGKEKTKISSVNSILSLPFFLFSTNCRYLEILLIQSFLIKLIIYLDFTLVYFVQRLTTPLGPELCIKINTSLAQVTCALDPFISCEYMIG